MPKRKKGKNLSRQDVKTKKLKDKRKNEKTHEDCEALLAENYQNELEKNLTVQEGVKNNDCSSVGSSTTSTQNTQHTLHETSKVPRLSNLSKNPNTKAAQEYYIRLQSKAQAQELPVRELKRAKSINNLEYEAFHYDPIKEYKKHKYVEIGKMVEICKFCKAKKYSGETPTMCCMNGKVKLQPLRSSPSEIFPYMIGDTSESKDFLKNYRAYNACFQMTSFGTTAKQENHFSTVFSIKGQIYHRMGSLLPLPHDTHKFLQVYFIGNEQEEIDQRVSNFNELKRDIIEILQKILHKHNQLIHIFKVALNQMPSDEFKIVIRADKRPIGEHERRFNAPQVNEIAIVIVDNEYTSRDIIIQRRKGGLQRIHESHRSYDALQYPLIFMYGEDGYHFNLKQINPKTGAETNKKISAKEFYAYRLMIRNDEKNNEIYKHITNSRALFQQFLVDMYAKIEAERMAYIRFNQKKLRSEEYIHLRDAIMNDVNITDIGKMVILPSSYIGSPRHMHEYAQDAMNNKEFYKK